MRHAENVARGYKAAIQNRNVSEPAREHSRQELNRLQSHELNPSEQQQEQEPTGPRTEPESLETHDSESDENASTGREASIQHQRHDENVRRGLLAATHNPNVTDVGKAQARGRLQSMGEDVEAAAD